MYDAYNNCLPKSAMTAETMARALGGRKAGMGWMAQCTAHGDREQSLSIRETDWLEAEIQDWLQRRNEASRKAQA